MKTYRIHTIIIDGRYIDHESAKEIATTIRAGNEDVLVYDGSNTIKIIMENTKTGELFEVTGKDTKKILKELEEIKTLLTKPKK